MPEGIDIPIQAVPDPILCSPYSEPDRHWVYDLSGMADIVPGRRRAGYYFKTQHTGSAQLVLPGLREENWEDLPLVNALREDVREWRRRGYRNPDATRVTRDLLQHWWREDRPRRLFFCQLEAVETFIYMNEVLGSGRVGPRRTRLSSDDFGRLCRGERPSDAFGIGQTATVFPTLVDFPAEAGYPPLRRYGCKMATGSGKTVVMSMLIAWAFCNRAKLRSDDRFPLGVLVCCPNLTIKERLQVLRPERTDNYYAAFDVAPAALRELLSAGSVLVTNWHAFAPESEHDEGGKSYVVVNKGPESPNAFARRVLGGLYDRGPILVLNDEGHHAYRPAPLEENLMGEERQQVRRDREEATVWVSGLDRINAACGVRCCMDLSATPFYLQGSGYAEGSPFPWLVSDFGLVDAIESGITKIPRLPVNDTTGKPEPQYFRLWSHIVDRLPAGDRLPGKARKPKPEALWREAQPALTTLASQWKAVFEANERRRPGEANIPPVLILVCDNTDIAQHFFERISGERQVKVESAVAAAEIQDAAMESELEGVGDPLAETEGPMPDPTNGARKPRTKTRTVYGQGELFPELLTNRPGYRPSIRIDTELLAQAESEEPGAGRAAAAEALRKVVATVGKPGEPGEQVRCVVSVAMLTEGWDASNVTHILGLRAFGTQLLCEQVVGRGLRRTDYTVNPATGLLIEEYVDVYGIPFSLIPFKGKAKVDGPPPPPKSRVQALPERAQYEIRFPVVDGYTFALKRNAITADVPAMQLLKIEPDQTPTAIFVKPSVGYHEGPPVQGPGESVEQNRKAYYASTHLQAIEFEIARRVVYALASDEMNVSGDGKSRLPHVSRHQLFPQVFRLVRQYVATKVDFRGESPCELGLAIYVDRLVGLMHTAIRPDESAGESPLIPILNRYKPFGTSAEVDFLTTRPCKWVSRTHVNQVPLDTGTWESSAAFRLEQSPYVDCYVRNDGMGFVISYDYLKLTHSYQPDFLVRLKNGTTLILEIKGMETEQDRAKHEAARRWVTAVNNARTLGRWAFHVCKDPQRLGADLAGRAAVR